MAEEQINTQEEQTQAEQEPEVSQQTTEEPQREGAPVVQESNEENKEFDWNSLSDEKFEQYMSQIKNNEQHDQLKAEQEQEEDNTKESDTANNTVEEEKKEEEKKASEEPTESADNTDQDSNEKKSADNTDQDSQKQENEAEAKTEDNNSDEEIPEKFKPIYDEYQKLKEFHDALNTEFVANGKKVKGSLNPEELITAQQMAMGLSKRFEAFNKYRPYLKPLQDREIIGNEEKFNLMLSVMDGDKEAIKKIIKDNNVDVVDLDMEDINYKDESKLADDIQIKVQDLYENAEMFGVQDKINKMESWDNDSVLKVLNEPAVKNDLLNHMANGAFDVVMEKVEEKRLKDFSGQLKSIPTIDLYIQTAKELAEEYNSKRKQTQQVIQENFKEKEEKNYQPTPKELELEAKLKKVEEEKRKIEEERKKREYEAKVKAEEEKRKKQKQAAMASTQVPTFAEKAEEFDPMKLSDEKFEAYYRGIIGR
jgi:hypothetical protein